MMAPPKISPGRLSKGPTARQLANYQLIWDYIRKARSFTAHGVAVGTGVKRRAIDAYLTRLEAAGKIGKTPDHDTKAQWAVVGEPSEALPVLRADGTTISDGGDTANMWRAMRMMRSFSPVDLSAHCTTPDVVVTQKQASEYC
ncbi:MAG: hypothetical protein MUF14_08595, partial [Hyphomonadaceae bacterium]|nr:hypothetical protein [Hyphomonadaceae bacterium]